MDITETTLEAAMAQCRVSAAILGIDGEDADKAYRLAERYTDRGIPIDHYFMAMDILRLASRINKNILENTIGKHDENHDGMRNGKCDGFPNRNQ